METFDATHNKPTKVWRRYKKLISGLVAIGVIIIVFLVSSVLFAFSYIRNSITSTSLTIPLLTNKPVENHIAFAGNDNNLWLVSPDGKDLQSITTDGRGYRSPAWSPDGRQVAFIGPDKADNTALYISSASRSNPITVFNKPNSAPFYLYWAPDSNSITFLTQELSGLSMRQIETHTPDMSRTLGEGAPFYWVWSPNSDKMLMHVGGSRAVSAKAHISLLDNRQEAQRVELDLAPGRFQAPVWSSDGKHIFYIATDNQRNESLYKTNAETLEQSIITNLGGAAHIILSPNNHYIAYLQADSNTPSPFGTAYLVNTEGENHQRLTEEPIASMYWSPDGAKLALLSISRANDGSTAQKIEGLAAPLAQEITLRWWIYNVKTEELEPLISFSPTQSFLQTVPFFDQYHLSLTFWSPDSRYFVVTKKNSQGGAVWVIDTSGQEEPQKIGEGTLAVWSWQ